MELIEIFTEHEDAFSVGEKVLEDRKYLIYKDLNELGMFTGYVLLRKSLIDAIEKNTEYLGVMREYVSYANEHPYDGWFDLPELKLKDGEDYVRQIVSLAEKEKEIIWVWTKEVPEMTYGFPELNGERFHLRCVAHDNALFFDEMDFDAEDIYYIGFGGIDCRLLKRAHEALEEK
ncbi:MAG: hypothetical protein K5985_12350 [Lachnospiraceae bacterium]|nr:hypothetical protein [Lachnospiraceae bacterium]